MLRRTFVKGIIITPFATFATPKPTPIRLSSSPVLEGNVFHLHIDYAPIRFTGKMAIATAVNGQVPAPTLVWNEGETVTIQVTNHLKTFTSIHWHGIILPSTMDGVPGLSFDGIAPGETFTYRFKVQQHGTYWYHSHSEFQEQTGLYGAIIIRAKKKDPFEYDKEYIVLLSDWSDEKPTQIYEKLKKMSSYYNYSQRTVGTFLSEAKEKGLSTAFSDRKMWNEMRMSDRDISDVSGATYTYLMNGKNATTQFKALFQKGEKIRLRFINAAAMTFFDVRIPELIMTVVAADGNHVKPIEIEEFRIGVAETYDVIVEPKKHQAYAIFAQSIDRSGYALGSLTPDLALLASPPAMDPMPILTHTDMGMGELDHGGDMKCDSSMMMSSKMSMKQNKYAQMEAQHYPITQLPMADGVQIDMRATSPQYRLDDPGVGLRNHGRKVLSYSDLQNRYSTRHAKKPDREIILHLTGNMERYIWSINGIKYADATPLIFRYGERIRITFINDTMMNHPMHLHGMWSDVETGDDAHLVRKHTVIVQPGAKISYRVTVDAKGKWAFHCHMLYHMLGMFREVHVV